MATMWGMSAALARLICIIPRLHMESTPLTARWSRRFFLYDVGSNHCFTYHYASIKRYWRVSGSFTPCPLPVLAGRHDDETVISLTRLPVNTPNPAMKAERVVL